MRWKFFIILHGVTSKKDNFCWTSERNMYQYASIKFHDSVGLNILWMNVHTLILTLQVQNVISFV